MSPALRRAHERRREALWRSEPGFVELTLSILPVDDDRNGHSYPLGISVAREHGWTLVPPRGKQRPNALRANQSSQSPAGRGSAISISRTRSDHPQWAVSPVRGSRAADLQPAYDVGPDLGGDPGQQLTRHQPKLGGPRGRLGETRQLAGLEPLRPAMGGDVGADDLLPPRQQAGRGQRPGPVAFGDKTVDRVAESGRVAVIRPGSAPRLLGRPRASGPARRGRFRATGAGEQ